VGDLIERLRDGLTLYSLNAEAADRIEELEAENERLQAKVEALEAIYIAVLPLKVSGTHLYDCDIALGQAIDDYEALAATEQEVSDE